MQSIETRVVQIDPSQPSLEILQQASNVLQAGGLVVIPTETVYGLAANALNSTAVERIYQAKGRPSNNPLIVHVCSIGHAKEFVDHWPANAQKLAESFWPGPLTMVLKSNGLVSSLVTAGGDSIAIRLPSHPVARALIQVSNLPLAAPSANTSGCVSPTSASHVVKDLQGKVEMILDAGSCELGIESTVVDVRDENIQILRPGSVTSSMISEVLRCKVNQPDSLVVPNTAMVSPGMLEKHYAPRTLAIWIETDFWQIAGEMKTKGLQIGVLAMEKTPGALCLGKDPVEYARKLYGALHALDDMGLDRILVIAPPDLPEWFAVRDRLRRATVRL